MFYCLVVGSRGFTNYDYLCKKMDRLLVNQTKVTIIAGECKYGVDKHIKKYAKDRGHEYIGFPADWSKGNRGGYERNRRMHEFIAKVAPPEERGVVALWDSESKGTAHSFTLAKEFENPIRVIEYTKDPTYYQNEKELNKEPLL